VADVPLPPADLRVADLDGRRVGIWGAGREGAAAVRALRRHAPGAALVVGVSRPPADGVPVVVGDAPPALTGEEAIAALAACDVVIRSPGVPVRGAEADRIRAGGATITSGTALWLAERAGRETVVGITGTKGKSTTASLVHHLLGAAGVRSALAGNIGRPLLDQLDPADPPEAWVVELSSYQLADLPRAPTVAVVTNLLRDHLPWHGDEATYHHDKLRILTAGGGARLAVLPRADAALRAIGERLGPRGVPVLWVDDPHGLHVADGALRDGSLALAPVEALPLRGTTGARNVAVALQVVRGLGHDVADVAGALRDFRPLPHRQEVVAVDATGRRWVDDSISTTPEAALFALAAFAPGPVVLIAGGDDRRQQHDALAEALATGRVPAGPADEEPIALDVAGLVALPGTGPALAAALRAEAGGRIAVREVAGEDPGAVMDAAVAAAAELAPPGATVLLSPAAPSHNVFRDFEDRGARFADAVARR